MLRVNGGRVLNVTAVASTLRGGAAPSREAAEAIEFEGKIFRRDIGWREAARLAGATALRAAVYIPGAMPELPKSKPSSATSAPPCSAAASTGSR